VDLPFDSVSETCSFSIKTKENQAGLEDPELPGGDFLINFNKKSEDVTVAGQDLGRIFLMVLNKEL
jgi:hypothetical protein